MAGSPQFARACVADRRQAPPADLTILRKELLHDYRQSAFRALVGIQAAIALEEEGISVAAFKGAASMAYLYGGPEYRTSQDVDLLIHPRTWQPR